MRVVINLKLFIVSFDKAYHTKNLLYLYFADKDSDTKQSPICSPKAVKRKLKTSEESLSDSPPPIRSFIRSRRLTPATSLPNAHAEKSKSQDDECDADTVTRQTDINKSFGGLSGDSTEGGLDDKDETESISESIKSEVPGKFTGDAQLHLPFV